MTSNLHANYFAARDYVSWDMRRVVLSSRAGTRLIAFPQEFTAGLQQGIEEECGEAWPVVMQRCGEWWGRREMARLQKELSTYFGQSLSELATSMVHTSLIESWATHGWGRISFDLKDIESGLMWATVKDAPVASYFVEKGRDPKGKPVDALLAGVLAGMFSEAAGGDVSCFEIACVARKEPECRFVVGHKPRLQEVREWVRQRVSADDIASRLKAAARGA